MDKQAAVHDFWSSFGLPAYDEGTVPQNAQMPYITYHVTTGALNDGILMTASLWYYSTTWADIARKSADIAEAIYNQEKPKKINGGYMWTSLGSPFAQRMTDPNDMVRRIVLQVRTEFLTAY